MPSPDYSAPADVYATAGRGSKRPMFYRRFASLAEAVKFVVEDLPQQAMHALVETETDRFQGAELRTLYDAETFPLRRAATHSTAA